MTSRWDAGAATALAGSEEGMGHGFESCQARLSFTKLGTSLSFFPYMQPMASATPPGAAGNEEVVVEFDFIDGQTQCALPNPTLDS